jgi:Ca2+-binding EF-hand superfamily protein
MYHEYNLYSLQAGLKAQRLQLSDEEARRFVNMIDADSNGTISISEFMVR